MTFIICITAISPTPALVEPLTRALTDLAPMDALSPDRIIPRLPTIVEILGPALLSYPGEHLAGAPVDTEVEVVPPAKISGLLAGVTEDELGESGLAEVTSSISIVRGDQGDPIAGCGYRYWPGTIAHLSVLTRAEHRGKGLARAVAIDATTRALTEGLLPQWRARTPASQSVAHAIGFEQLGAQLSLRPADPSRDAGRCGAGAQRPRIETKLTISPG
jgi:GNAT superfamily N-acetyltransferase